MKKVSSSIVKFIRRLIGTNFLNQLAEQERQLTELNTKYAALQEKLELASQLINTLPKPSKLNTSALAKKREPLISSKLGRQIISIRDETRFDLTVDFELFLLLVEDMKLNGKNLVPIGVWNEYSVDTSITENVLQQTFRDNMHAIFLTKFATMKLMMDPWIGCIGMQPVSEEQIDHYSTVLNNIDHCGLIGQDLFTTAIKQNMLNTDLGSMLDVNTIAGLAPIQKDKRYFILEIGGGYGRLAEALTNAFDNEFHYVLVDAVPGSLLYAQEYLKKAFPHKKIGFYLTDTYDPSYDFYILPPWHLDRIKNTSFNIGINIESMQEMVQEHVDFYVNIFDECIECDGTIYISNSRNYRFQGIWKFPDHWQRLLCHNTPRSWTNNHPTVVFKKTSENWSVHNTILEGLYTQQISDWDAKQNTIVLQKEIEWRDTELKRYRSEVVVNDEA